MATVLGIRLLKSIFGRTLLSQKIFFAVVYYLNTAFIKMIIDFSEGKEMKLDGLEASTVVLPNGSKAMQIKAHPGFDWLKTISPMMPGCPASCPVTHIGYVVSGKMSCKFNDGSVETYEAGQSYYIKPGHIPSIEEECVAVEFSPEAVKMVEKASA